METKPKYFLLPLILLTIGCHYNNANIIIQNDTDKEICYSTLAKNLDNTFYEISAGGKIDSHNSESPIVRGGSDRLKTDIDTYSDKSIYFVFYNPKDQQYVFKNVDSMLNTGIIKIMKFRKNELEKMNWKIMYTEK